jgi:hypothetical protein
MGVESKIFFRHGFLLGLKTFAKWGSVACTAVSDRRL